MSPNNLKNFRMTNTLEDLPLRLLIAVTVISNFMIEPFGYDETIFIDQTNTKPYFDRVGISGVEAYRTPLVDQLQYAPSEIELSLSASNLKDRNLLTRSDPFCVVSTKPLGSTIWTIHDETESLVSDHHPHWLKKPKLPFSFGEQQTIKFEVCDYDSNRQRQPLGYAECDLGELVRVGTMTIPLQKASGTSTTGRGQITVTAEKLSGNQDLVQIEMEGENLESKNRSWYSKNKKGSDSYMEICRVTDTHQCELIVKTEVIVNNLAPVWQAIRIPARSLSGGDPKRALKFFCWDYDKPGKRDLIGQFSTTFHELSSRSTHTFELTNAIKKTRTAGKIKIKFKHIEVPTFADFIRGNLQIHCTIAIDYSETNKIERLHNFNKTDNKLNQYEETINAVVSIIEKYDTDKNFPVYGFAARSVRDKGLVLPVFNINEDGSNCLGVQGVLQAYRKSWDNFAMASPVNFAPVIQKVTKSIPAIDQHNYHILLILTSGQIFDLPMTETVIKQVSSLPLSIIIVGIGNSSFANMQKLDADLRPGEKGKNKPVTTASNDATVATTRDIVQFVALRDFRKFGNDHDASLHLAKKLLDEVPGQVESYMRMHDFQPTVRSLDVHAQGLQMYDQPSQVNYPYPYMNVGGIDMQQQLLYGQPIMAQQQQQLYPGQPMQQTQVYSIAQQPPVYSGQPIATQQPHVYSGQSMATQQPQVYPSQQMVTHQIQQQKQQYQDQQMAAQQPHAYQGQPMMEQHQIHQSQQIASQQYFASAPSHNMFSYVHPTPEGSFPDHTTYQEPIYAPPASHGPHFQVPSNVAQSSAPYASSEQQWQNPHQQHTSHYNYSTSTTPSAPPIESMQNAASSYPSDYDLYTPAQSGPAPSPQNYQ